MIVEEIFKKPMYQHHILCPPFPSWFEGTVLLCINTTVAVVAVSIEVLGELELKPY